ncbi:hypothetical protein ABZ345_47035, partial [Lentzea sp. NPDC005914]|uniref:hypothetical protein n=1 Tax=Lentzea sp. NPDC005914 TaxID=3154572 RepID=UPI0033C430A0
DHDRLNGHWPQAMPLSPVPANTLDHYGTTFSANELIMEVYANIDGVPTTNRLAFKGPLKS